MALDYFLLIEHARIAILHMQSVLKKQIFRNVNQI